MNKRIFFAGLLSAAMAAQEKPVMEMSLKQAVEMALAPDGATRARLAREAVTNAKAQQREALGYLLPNIDGYAGYTRQTVNLKAFGLSFSIPGFGETPTLVGPFSVFDLRGQVTQSVFDLSAIDRYRARVQMSTEARQEKDRAEQLVMERVARSYLTALRAQANVDASKANVTLAEALVKLAQSQKNAGTGTGIEVTRASVQLANEQQHLVAAENDYQLAALGLLREIGASLDTSVKLTDSMNYKAIAPEPVETAIQQAMKDRADFLAQQTRESAAKTNYDSVKWERLPSLGISGDYGTIGPGFSNAIPTWKAQATLRVPIYDGGRRDARRAEAASALRSEQIRSRDLKQQVELELRTALKELQSAEAQMKAAQEGLDLSNNELAQARRRYEAGITNSLEVTDAQTRLARARDNYTIALYGHNVARLDLQSAMGALGQLVQ